MELNGMRTIAHMTICAQGPIAHMPIAHRPICAYANCAHANCAHAICAHHKPHLHTFILGVRVEGDGLMHRFFSRCVSVRQDKSEKVFPSLVATFVVSIDSTFLRFPRRHTRHSYGLYLKALDVVICAHAKCAHANCAHHE